MEYRPGGLLANSGIMVSLLMKGLISPLAPSRQDRADKMGSIFAFSVLGLSFSPPLLHVRQRGAALSRAHAGAIAMQALPADSTYVTTASGLKYLDEKVGSGEEASNGAMIKVDYTGTLASDGSQFDSSKGRAPITFELGAGRVIPG